ncbi:hypothetical protein [Aquidulcibacter sp.]|nr:hypothetical protein [Aquidulcibacter sp.]
MGGCFVRLKAKISKAFAAGFALAKAGIDRVRDICVVRTIETAVW